LVSYRGKYQPYCRQQPQNRYGGRHPVTQYHLFKSMPAYN